MNFFEEEEEKSLVYSAGVGANNRVPNDESQAWLMQMRDPGGGGGEEKYRERTGFATRSPARSSKERKKSVLKFGILFEIHILSTDVEKFSMIGMNIREFLNSTGKKTGRLFRIFQKLRGKIRR